MSRAIVRAAAAAAALALSVLVLPASPAAAHDWTTVQTNGQPIVQGSGRVVKQQRQVGTFRAVAATGSEVVEVRFGDRPSVVVAADDNVLPFIVTEVKNGTLKIGSRGSYRVKGPIRVYITTPQLDSYVAVGSGSATIEGVDNERLALTITGSGGVKASGRTRELVLTINGSGNADLARLVADQVNVALRGSGNTTVRSVRKLSARVYGSGSVRYLGEPEVDQQRFGSGTIRRAS